MFITDLKTTSTPLAEIMQPTFGSIAISSSPAIVPEQSPALSSTPRQEKVSHNTRSFATVYSDLMTELYNEPTQGLYFVNQSLQKMGPRLVTIKYSLDSIRQKLSTALTDVTEDIDAVDKILKSQCNLDGKSNAVQQLKHEFGHHSNRKKQSLSKASDNEQMEQKNDENNENDDDDEEDDDFGFGEFLQISVMLSQCRSLMQVAANLD